MRRAIGKAAVKQGTSKKDDSGDQSNPVQLTQSAPHHIARQMGRGQNRERRGRKHESKKDQPADPADQRQQHEETKQRHSGRIIVCWLHEGRKRCSSGRANPVKLATAYFPWRRLSKTPRMSDPP